MKAPYETSENPASFWLRCSMKNHKKLIQKLRKQQGICGFHDDYPVTYSYKSVTYLSHEIAVMYHSWACLIFILIKTIHLGEVVVWPQEKATKIPFWDTFETLFHKFHNTKCWVV